MKKINVMDQSADFDWLEASKKERYTVQNSNRDLRKRKVKPLHQRFNIFCTKHDCPKRLLLKYPKIILHESRDSTQKLIQTSFQRTTFSPKLF
jgi:hypothetical protein